MDVDERLDRISPDVRFVPAVERSQNDQIAKLVAEGAHQDRLDDLER